MLKKNLNLTLTASRHTFSPDSPLMVACVDCKSGLDVHQPDMAQPERLLGTCEQCGAWYLLACRADRRDMVVMRLPEEAEIAEAASRLGIGPAPGG